MATKPDLELVRFSVHRDGAFGVLLDDGLPFALTLERTYEQSSGVQVVKIPSGEYVCRQRFYFRGGYDTYEVTGVPGHSLLLFHKGNVERDADGCILLGRRPNPEGAGILESALAFADFMERTAGIEQFQLVVRGVFQ